MTVGIFSTVLGTQLNDIDNEFEGNNLEIVYGLGGNDSASLEAIINEQGELEEGVAFFLGGEGDDSYSVGSNSYAIILETGDSGGDTLFAPNLKINGDNTYGLTIDNRHLYFADLDTDTYILLLDWQSETVIDTFDFADDTLTFQQAQNLVNSSDPNDPESGFLGNFTWEQVQTDSRLVEAGANIDLSLVGLSPETIDAAIEEVKATEANFQDTITIVQSGRNIDGDLTNEDNSYIFNRETYYYDFYSIEDVVEGLEPGDFVDINVDADGFDPLLFVLDSRGNVIEDSEDGNLTFVVGSGEPFSLSVESQAANDTGRYTLDVDILDEDEGNLLGATEAIVGFDSIGTSETINGSLADDDIVFLDEEDNQPSLTDGYSLTGATLGQQIRISLNADFDGELGIGVVDSDLNPVEDKSDTFNDNLGGNVGSEQITFTVEEGFDYFFSVNSFEPGVTGNYTLTTEVI